MAKSTPGTAGSKGGGNVVPSTGFPTRGGVLRSQIPVGRGTVPDNYDYGRNMPRRFPMPAPGTGTIFRPPPISRPMPRPPMRPTYGSGATNFYRRPSYSYGVPTGLSALLSGQQSPFGRMVDPATGFPQRTFPRPVMGRPDFGQIGRSTSSGKSGSKGGARTVNPESQAVVDEYNRNPDPTLGESLPPPTSGTVTGLPSGLTPEQARIRQEELASRTGGGFSRLAPSDVQVSDVFMDAVESAPLLGNNPPPIPAQDFTGAPPPMMDASQYLRAGGGGRGVPPILTQGLPERPDLIPRRPARSVSQTPEESLRQRALAGNRRGTGLDLSPVVTAPRQVELMPALAPPPPTPPVQQQIAQAIQMEQADVRPNVRPTPAPVVAPAPVIVPKPAPVVAAPTSPSDVQQQIMRQIQMEQARGRSNIRPTMNVGKATGGPVGIHSGIASLVGRR